MKRRSRAGREPIKGRRRKTPEPKRSNAPKAAPRSNSSAITEETEVARLTRELSDERKQRTATSEVLHLLSGSHGDLPRLFNTILTSATKLCQANFGTLSLYEGDAFRIVAMHDVPPALAELRRREPLVRAGPLLRIAETKRLLHIVDYTEYVASHPADSDAAAFAKLTGVRTMLGVPMLKDGGIVGATVVYRQEVRAFSDREIVLIKSFAAQAVIAIENARLLNELRQRTTELTEALEQQTATSDMLQVISRSPGDLEPVFASMLEKAVRICDATFGNIYRWDGEFLSLVAVHNTPPAFAEARRLPRRPNPNNIFGRMLATNAVVHILDAAQLSKGGNREYDTAVELGGVRTSLAVPMLKGHELIGSISLFRQKVRPFNDKQIASLTNFAAQAVIAIENARLLNELRQRTTDLTERTADLTEALEQQTATSEVLQVISSSPGDLEPVFASMLENAARICDANFGNIFRWDGDALWLVATHNTPAAFIEHRRRVPFSPNQGNPIGDMLKANVAIHVADLAADERYITQSDPEVVAAVELGGIRTFVAVPMLKDKMLIGAVIVYRQEVRPFSEKQIELVKNFAAQAVIAIENVRLLSELRQSLEQQTATSEVLQVISASPGELEPVFTTMLEKAVRICDAKYGSLYLRDNGKLRLVAAHDVPEFLEARRGVAFDPAPDGGLDEAIRNKRAVQIPDLAATSSYMERHPGMVEAVELAGIRTGVAVPMLKDDEVIGVIAIHRREVLPFTGKQVELLTNFAAQAVIAIENARLLNELRQRTANLTEALEQQTATSEVLQVISSSPGDLEPVFASMLEKAIRVCEATFGNIYRWDGEAFYLLATKNTPQALAEYRRSASPVVRPAPNTLFGRLAAARKLIHIPDLAADQLYSEKISPAVVAAVELGGVRTILVVPMLKEDELIGCVFLFRQETNPFTEKQIDLVKNFAAQAVIAIENARLLKELRQRTEQVEAQSQELVKLNQQLEQRVSDQVGEIERMGRLRRFLPPQVADLIVASGSEKQLESHRREITALFCDLRGFTGFSESADPEDVMTLLREYHEAIGASIIKYSGTLERYAGDGVMVVFNDPVPVENPALQAVLMALEMRDAIGALTETWRRWGHDIGFGIGIAHGFATLGTIGFEGRFDYAAIGTVSNVASRLCDEAKPGQILISPRVLTKVENAVKVEPVGEFELKGIRRPLAAYNVVAAQSSLT